MASSTSTRILVLSESPEVLHAVGQAAQPLGYLLFQVEGPDDLGLRVRDLQPDIVVIDGEAAGTSDAAALKSALL